MSENVGLSTPRGSGTSGYVQRNLAHLKPRDRGAPYPPRGAESAAAPHRPRQPDREILEHDRKRAVEVKVVELRDELEEAGELGEEQIEERCDALRKKLLAELEQGKAGSGPGRGQLKAHQVHELAEAKMHETERLRLALKISRDYEEGSHWRRQEERMRKAVDGGGEGEDGEGYQKQQQQQQQGNEEGERSAAREPREEKRRRRDDEDSGRDRGRRERRDREKGRLREEPRSHHRYRQEERRGGDARSESPHEAAPAASRSHHRYDDDDDERGDDGGYEDDRRRGVDEKGPRRDRDRDHNREGDRRRQRSDELRSEGDDGYKGRSGDYR